MKRNLFYCLFAVLCFSLGTASATISNVKGKQIPAVYKTGNGMMQKVELVVDYVGAIVSADVKLGNDVQKVELKEGENKILFEIPLQAKNTKLSYEILAGTEKKTGKIAVGPVRHWQMNMVQHTHTDIGYTRSQMEILAEHQRYIDYALDYCDATDSYPEFAQFKWTCEIAWAVSEYLKNKPAKQIERLKQRVDEGRIEIAGMYLNFDELPDEQTLAASLAPLKLFREKGLKAELAMQNDVNGIGWCFSEFFPDLGVKYINMGTHGHRALICFDKPTVFWWESPSGKKILTYRAEHYHTGNMWGVHADDFEAFEKRVLNYLDEMEAKNYPYDVLAIQHSGYLTDNAPPSTKSSEMLLKWNEKYEWPKLRTAVASEFIKSVEKDYASQIPTVRGAWPDWWTDGFASGAREAAVSRITHADAIASQGALSFAQMQGAVLPDNTNDQIDEINNALLFYDEHTFGHSESVRNPYELETWEQRSLKQSYAWEAYRRVSLLGEVAMGALQQFTPKVSNPSLVVYNTLNWAYSGIAKVYIDHQQLPTDKDFEIVDEKGRVMPAQASESRRDGTYWNVYVKDIPALGYAQYYIRVKNTPRKQLLKETKLTNPRVENQWYSIDFNARKGTISKLFDKELGKQLLAEKPEWEMGEFIYEIIDSRRPMEQYRKPQFLRRSPERIRFVHFEEGPIWNSYRFVTETPAGRDADNLIVEYRVFNVEKKIEIVYKLRKKAITDPEAVYVSFPYEVAGGKIWLDVPGGNIEAGVDQIPGSSNDWYTVQNYAAARSNDSQIIMGSCEIPLMQFGAINTGRYDAGAKPQSTNMYSWPMNNYWTTNFNADQMGQVQWSYFITSSADNSIQRATRFAWENRVPLRARVLPAGNEAQTVLPAKSIFRIIPENLLLVNMKPVKNERAVLLQLREVGGKQATFAVESETVRFNNPVVCNVLGIPMDTNNLEFKPWENKFIKLSW
ncbi:MAG: glycosyl hydrolase family 38 [Bacteroides sp.]|nr:glycosyl hydrolase family 38 [Bacteroides sp.]